MDSERPQPLTDQKYSRNIPHSQTLNKAPRSTRVEYVQESDYNSESIQRSGVRGGRVKEIRVETQEETSQGWKQGRYQGGEVASTERQMKRPNFSLEIEPLALPQHRYVTPTQARGVWINRMAAEENKRQEYEHLQPIRQEIKAIDFSRSLGR